MPFRPTESPFSERGRPLQGGPNGQLVEVPYKPVPMGSPYYRLAFLYDALLGMCDTLPPKWPSGEEFEYACLKAMHEVTTLAILALGIIDTMPQTLVADIDAEYLTPAEGDHVRQFRASANLAELREAFASCAAREDGQRFTSVLLEFETIVMPYEHFREGAEVLGFEIPLADLAAGDSVGYLIESWNGTPIMTVHPTDPLAH